MTQHPHPAAPQEVELKLALGPGALDALLAHPLLAEPPQQQALANTYFDTPQGHLAAGRVAVRLRRLGPRVLQTVKTAGQGGGGLSRREEWEWPLDEHALDQAGLAELPPFQGPLAEQIAALQPTLSTDFHRRTWQLAWQGSTIELVVDEGEIVAGSARAPIGEVELELKEGSADALWGLALALAEQVALRPSDSSKAARGNALGQQQWTLPEASTPSAWLHRATVALDAFHDSGHPEHLAAAQQALSELAQHPALDDTARREALTLTAELGTTGQPTAAYGVAALTLARRLGQQTALR